MMRAKHLRSRKQQYRDQLSKGKLHVSLCVRAHVHPYCACVTPILTPEGQPRVNATLIRERLAIPGLNINATNLFPFLKYKAKAVLVY